jgi:hypothetical protein
LGKATSHSGQSTASYINDKSTSIRETHKSSLIFDSPFVVPLTSAVEKAGVISTEKSMLTPLQRTENTASRRNLAEDWKKGRRETPANGTHTESQMAVMRESAAIPQALS